MNDIQLNDTTFIRIEETGITIFERIDGEQLHLDWETADKLYKVLKEWCEYF